MADIGKAYVQIIPKADGISGKVEGLLGGGAASGGRKAGNAAGSGMLSGITKVMTVAAVGAPIIAGVKEALSEGAALEQSYIGGLDTLYGESADRARELAKEASAAGISMNDYSEQAVSFGAALKQSFGGDTSKAVEAANTAILDMADNAAKMGTPLESIQNAYQGFAKGNYTMLDNLKLGYGGTKTEMERLLADAQKISGVKYDIGNLGDVYDAIHVVQGELGLTGVAAAEASETFSGSFNAMKAAAANLFGSMAIEGGDVTGALSTLLKSAGTFLFKNAIPMIGRVFKAIPSAIGTLIKEGGPQLLASGQDLITNLMTGASTAIPQIMGKATEIIENIRSAITTGFPVVLQQGAQLMENMLNGITSILPSALAKGREIILNIINGILGAMPQLISTLADMLAGKITFVSNNLPTIIAEGKKLIMGIVDGIKTNGPAILTALVNAFNTLKAAISPAISKLVNAIATNGPSFLAKGKDMFLKLLDGFLEALPGVLAKLPGIVGDIVGGITDFISTNLPKLVEAGAKAGKDFVVSVGKVIGEHAPEVLPAIGEIVVQAGKGLSDLVAKSMEIAGDVIKALADGLGVTGAIDQVKTAVQNIVNAIKNKFRQAVSSVKSSVNQIKNAIVMTGIPAKVAKTFSDVKSKVTSKLNAVKSTVQGIVNKIKGIFPLSIGQIFSNIKLPHINVSGGTPPYGIAGLGTTPSFSVQWYAKGGIIDGPSVIGVGEKGREAVIPLSGANMRPFADAIAEGIGNNGSTYNFNITVSGAENPEEFADRLMRRLQMKARTA